MMRLATGEAAAVESTCTAYVLEARNSASRDLASSSEAAWRGWGCARELSAAAARPTLPRSRIRRLLAGRVPPAGDSWWRITITGQRGIDRGEHTELCIRIDAIPIVATTARTLQERESKEKKRKQKLQQSGRGSISRGCLREVARLATAADWSTGICEKRVYKAVKRSALAQGSYTNYYTHLVYRTHSLLAKQMITNRTSLDRRPLRRTSVRARHLATAAALAVPPRSPPPTSRPSPPTAPPPRDSPVRVERARRA